MLSHHRPGHLKRSLAIVTALLLGLPTVSMAQQNSVLLPAPAAQGASTPQSRLLKKGTGTTTNSGLTHGQVQPVVEPVPLPLT